jgi:hypothetical protein
MILSGVLFWGVQLLGFMKAKDGDILIALGGAL